MQIDLEAFPLAHWKSQYVFQEYYLYWMVMWDLVVSIIFFPILSGNVLLNIYNSRLKGIRESGRGPALDVLELNQSCECPCKTRWSFAISLKAVPFVQSLMVMSYNLGVGAGTALFHAQPQSGSSLLNGIAQPSVCWAHANQHVRSPWP